MAPKISAQKKRCDSWVPQKKKKKSNGTHYTVRQGLKLQNKFRIKVMTYDWSIWTYITPSPWFSKKEQERYYRKTQAKSI